MSDQQWLVNTVTSTTTHVHGRSLVSAGVHHFILDGPNRPNEEVVSMEAFLAGIASCATHLLQDFAEEEGIRLDRADVRIEAVRPGEDPSRFDHIDLWIDLTGPTTAQAEYLAERFKGR
jgi:uncharacterized OsmC-like protein